MQIHSTPSRMTFGPVAELDRLGDEIAELSAHLEAASARLLDLIREFDARGGWCNGFRSCADWLGWRVGLDLGTAREKVRVARALATLPLLAQALARGELSYANGAATSRPAEPNGNLAARRSLMPPPTVTSARVWAREDGSRSGPGGGMARSRKATDKPATSKRRIEQYDHCTPARQWR